MKSESQQWIPLTGPGGRLPTRDDTDNDGCVYYLDDAKTTWRALWSSCNGKGITHFCPIPKAPPLPKTLEKTQDQKDRDKAGELFSGTGLGVEDVVDGIRYGRAAGRAQLAREALVVFKEVNLVDSIEVLTRTHCYSDGIAIKRLYALLVKAQEETP